MTSDVAAHLSARVGGVFGDTLVFGKLGVGVSRVTDTFSADMTAVSTCSQFTGSFPFTCIERQFGGRGSYDAIHWVPSVLFGFGAEHNIGQFFVRVNTEAEMMASQRFSAGSVLSDGTRTTTNGTVIGTGPGGSVSGFSGDFNGIWTFRAGGMIGVRF